MRPDHLDERLGTVGSGLEERLGRDAPPTAGDLVVDPRPPPGLELVGADHQHVVGERDALGGGHGDAPCAPPWPRRRAARPRRPRRSRPRAPARRAAGGRRGSGRSATTSWLSARRRPARPSTTARRSVVRKPHGESDGPAPTTGSSMRPRRRSASVTRSTLARTCALGSRVCEVAAAAPVGDVRAAGPRPGRARPTGDAAPRPGAHPCGAAARPRPARPAGRPAPAPPDRRDGGPGRRRRPRGGRRRGPRPPPSRRSDAALAGGAHGGWSASDGGRSVTSPTVGGYRPDALSLVREGSHAADRAPHRRDRPLRPARRLRPPRRRGASTSRRPASTASSGT